VWLRLSVAVADIRRLPSFLSSSLILVHFFLRGRFRLRTLARRFISTERCFGVSFAQCDWAARFSGGILNQRAAGRAQNILAAQRQGQTQPGDTRHSHASWELPAKHRVSFEPKARLMILSSVETRWRNWLKLGEFVTSVEFRRHFALLASCRTGTRPGRARNAGTRGRWIGAQPPGFCPWIAIARWSLSQSRVDHQAVTIVRFHVARVAELGLFVRPLAGQPCLRIGGRLVSGVAAPLAVKVHAGVAGIIRRGLPVVSFALEALVPGPRFDKPCRRR
jgi:hypothetical protein